MSKAFTSEDARNEPLAGVLPQDRRIITDRGMMRLQEQLKQLAETERPQLLRQAAQGDVHCRARLKALDIRIRRMQRVISLCDVVAAPTQAPPQVVLGARVALQDDRGQQKTVTVVGPDELDDGPGRISYGSPLGRALMGLGMGAWAYVERPKDTIEWQILTIEAF